MNQEEIHWASEGNIYKELEGAKPLYVAACDRSIREHYLDTRVSIDFDKVTCQECLKRASPVEQEKVKEPEESKPIVLFSKKSEETKTYPGVLWRYPFNGITEMEQVHLVLEYQKNPSDDLFKEIVCSVAAFLSKKVRAIMQISCIEQDEWEAQALRSLWKAVNTFDTDKEAYGSNIPFLTYLIQVIRTDFFRLRISKNRIIRVPCKNAMVVDRLERRWGEEKEIELLETKDFLTPSEQGNMSQNQAEYCKHILTWNFNSVNIDGIVDETDWWNLLYMAMDLQVLKSLVKKALSDREFGVVCRCFGAYGHDSETLEEVSQWLGKTRERVRQIREEAVRKIRQALREQKGKDQYI